MIHPPFSAPLEFHDVLTPLGGESIWFIFSGEKLLVSSDCLPLSENPFSSLQRTLYIGRLAGNDLFAAEVDQQASPPQDCFFAELRSLYGEMGDDFFAAAGRALHLLEWDRSNKFCGRCGALTFARDEERCRECSACKYLSYPKVAPVVMALVRRDQKILLARGSHFPEKMFSVLAGFVGPGETLEQCVMREVFEEVGIRVKNIRYFGSQPWPLSSSLMIAFICDWAGGEIAVDPKEIEAAGWYGRGDFPQLPMPLSLARILIEELYPS